MNTIPREDLRIQDIIEIRAIEAGIQQPYTRTERDLMVTTPQMEAYPDIGRLGQWSVSSFKFGFGPECLRDNDPETFWHSDGPQPHYITIQFVRKVQIQKIALFLSFPLDDSYTPSAVCIRAGTSLGDLQDVRVLTLDKPTGWLTFDLSSDVHLSVDNDHDFQPPPISAYVLQIVVLENHMKGKDTHVRGVRILGPIADSPLDDDDPFPFTSREYKMYQAIR